MSLTTQSAHRKDIRSGKGARMEHRHFSFIAATIAEMPIFEGGTSKLAKFSRQEIADMFAEACRGSNPRFDRERFMRACGMT